MNKIGNTQLVRLINYEKKNSIKAKLYGKLEFQNPFGSIKDRAAFEIINEAEKEGLLSNNSCIIEATSGNMGIALAGICQVKGYKCKIIMPENMSKQRKALIQKNGAELILTPAYLGMQGSIDKAQEIMNNTTNIYYPDQFNNYASIKAHLNYTSPEIFKQTDGRIDIIIAGIGTGATISGLGTYFKSIDPSIKIIGVLPAKHPHKIQGIGAGFEPPLLNRKVLDQIVTVDDRDAFHEADQIYKTDKLKIGISSGAVIAGMKQYIYTNNRNDENIVLIFADGSDRYK